MDIIPISILVIENHPIMREALCSAITAEPDLAVAEPEALQMVIAVKPDTILLAYKPNIILLALDNPGLDDLETLRNLRKSMPYTPILALTSNEVAGQEQSALDAGAHAVLTKAAPRNELIKKLRELWSRKTLKHLENILQK
jgi:DNA-binding NarL/FixJ family response regulator